MAFDGLKDASVCPYIPCARCVPINVNQSHRASLARERSRQAPSAKCAIRAQKALLYKRQDNDLHAKTMLRSGIMIVQPFLGQKAECKAIGLEPVVTRDLELVRARLPMNVDLHTFESEPTILVPRLSADLSHTSFELCPRHFFQSKV
jgi:hypothetical protein